VCSETPGTSIDFLAQAQRDKSGKVASRWRTLETPFTVPPKNVTEKLGSPPASLKERSMADDRSIRGAADRSRINMQEDYEIRYWTQKWNVSREQLAAAVREVGVMVADVARKLGKNE